MTYMRRIDGSISVKSTPQIAHNRKRGQRRHTYARGMAQKFIAIDGEAFENGYCLLDSSIDSFPRLYSETPLQPMQVFDWLWELASQDEASGTDLVLYGAGYDFNNWLHYALHFDRELHTEGYECLDHRCLCKFCEGDWVTVDDIYFVMWQKGYKFALRKRGEQVQRKGFKPLTEVTIWDTQPFFQCTFESALQKYNIDVPAIIHDGKEARGTFKHSQLEWVSEYNKTECKLLIKLLDELKQSMHYVGIKLANWNGPGAAAKAKMKSEDVLAHNGRTNAGRGDYMVPDALFDAMLSAYAGGMARCLAIGHVDRAYTADINSAYPFQLTQVPCLTHGHWEHSTHYIPNKFGVWHIEYNNIPTSRPWIEPLFCRVKGNICYPDYVCRWAYAPEVDAILRHKPKALKVIEGYYWEPDWCEKPRPWQFLHREAMARLAFKEAGNLGPALVLKLMLNAAYGSCAQATGSSDLHNAPWSQQMMWAGWITAATRMKLWQAAMTAPESVLHMATDGILSTEALLVHESPHLGDWERGIVEDLTVVQFGFYFGTGLEKTRGFSKEERIQALSPTGLKPNEQMIHDIRAAWAQQTGVYRNLPYDYNAFVTAHEVRQGIAEFDNWCKWETRQKFVDIALVNEQHRLPRWPKGDNDVVQYFEDVNYDAGPWEDNWDAPPYTDSSEPHKPRFSKSHNWPVKYDMELTLEQI